MQIVINIPKEAYNLLQNEGVDWLGAEHILNAVANGTPLQEGHGRIGDFDAFLKGFLFDKRADNFECGWIRELIEQTTIIEADKESE